MFRLRQLRKERNITLKAFGKLFGLAESTISLYESEKRQPDMDTMQKFADFFGVTVDYLLGREEAQQKMPPVTDDLDKELIALLTGMSSDKKQRILDFAHGIDAAK